MNTTTLGDALPIEQARCRKLLARYHELGRNGVFGAAVVEAALAEADQAVISGELPRMIEAYKRLKGCE